MKSWSGKVTTPSNVLSGRENKLERFQMGTNDGYDSGKDGLGRENNCGVEC